MAPADHSGSRRADRAGRGPGRRCARGAMVRWGVARRGSPQIVPPPAEVALQVLWDYLLVARPPAPADVIFVFGSQDLAMPDRAAELYRGGHAPAILATGGFGRMTRGVFDQPEALVFRDRLLAAGVPETAIVTETEAGNTLENVRLGLAALRRAGRPTRSALLVAKGFVTRRAVATFAAQAPDVRVRACPPTTRLAEAMDRSAERLRRPAGGGDRPPRPLRRLRGHRAPADPGGRA